MANAGCGRRSPTGGVGGADGNPATVGNGVTVSFEAPDRSSVDAFYATALDAGARDEGAAGPRGWAPNAYAAYVRDMDGNKTCGVLLQARLSAPLLRQRGIDVCQPPRQRHLPLAVRSCPGVASKAFR